MNRIDNLSDEASQLTRVILPDGTFIVLELTYRPAVQRWTFNVARDAFKANGMNLCVLPNVLREWRNVLPCGLACVTTDGADPVDVTDFATGRASLFLLSADDVKAVELNVFGSLQ